METVPTSLFLAKLRIYLDKRKKPLPTVYRLKELLKNGGCLLSRLVERQPTIGIGADGMSLETCPLPPINQKTVPQASCPRVCPNRGDCLPSRLVERQPTIGLGADGMSLETCPGLPLTKKPSLKLHARGTALKTAAAYSPVLWTVPSAQPGLTSLFGMGRGGTPAP